MGLSAGTKLGPYEIVSMLGAGGMGEVYRARDLRLERAVAIKLLPASFASDSDRLSRFEQEARTVALLNHPNIVAVFDVGAYEGMPYLVTELLEGETLRERLHEGVLPQRRAIQLACQVATGLATAHDKGIIHRDLKPENIFITRDGRVKILDFGLAKLIQSRSAAASSETVTSVRTVDTSPGVVLGTALYMSPEQVRGKELDARTDLFSFGVILYEMLSGDGGFRRESSVETMNAILKEDLPDFREELHVPPALDRIVRRCVEKDPANRFQSAKDLAFALETLSGTTSAIRQPEPRKSRLALMLAIIAVAAILGLAAWELFWRPASGGTTAFQEITFRRGSIQAARFGPDGVSILYSAQWEGSPPELETSRLGSSEFRSLGLPSATLAAVSSQGELAILLNCQPFFVSDCGGTLAKVPAGGGAPRQLLDNVHYADWSPDGNDLAVVVQEPNGRNRLEYPIGHSLYETAGWITSPRISPDGKLIAFANHALPNDDRGDVAVIGTDGKLRTLIANLVSVEGLAWAPSGKEIFFAASGSLPQSKSAWADSLYATDLKGRSRKLTDFPGIVRLYDLSRDGRFLLSRETWRHQITGIFPGDSSERPYSWLDWSIPSGLSADGKFLLFTEAGSAASDTYATYLRPTDGSPAVRLSSGAAVALSPDGKWAAVEDLYENVLRLVPTGAGTSRTLEKGAVLQFDFPGRWSEDGQILAFTAQEQGRGACVYLQSVAGGPPRRVTTELQPLGMLRPHFALSHDAKLVAAIPAGANRIHLFDGSGQDLGELRGAKDAEAPAAFVGNEKLLVGPVQGTWPLSFTLIDIKTGNRTPWKQLTPLDRTGVRTDWDLAVTPDLKFYAYAVTQATSELFEFELNH